jgi:hypothetical protein
VHRAGRLPAGRPQARRRLKPGPRREPVHSSHRETAGHLPPRHRRGHGPRPLQPGAARAAGHHPAGGERRGHGRCHRPRPARAALGRAGRRRQRPHLPPRRGEPGVDLPRRGVPDLHRHAPRHRGQPLLRPRRHQRPGHGAGAARERVGRRRRAGRVHDHPAAREERARRVGAEPRAQGAGGGPGPAPRGPDDEGRDPRALLEHRVPRQQHLRRAGGCGALLRRQRRGPRPRAVGAARRDDPEPGRPRPVPAPGGRRGAQGGGAQPAARHRPDRGGRRHLPEGLAHPHRGLPRLLPTQGLLRRGGQGAPPRRRAARCHPERALQRRVPRRPHHPHDRRAPPPAAGRPGRQRGPPGHRRQVHRLDRQHRPRGTARCGPWSAGPGFGEAQYNIATQGVGRQAARRSSRSSWPRSSSRGTRSSTP